MEKTKKENQGKEKQMNGWQNILIRKKLKN